MGAPRTRNQKPKTGKLFSHHNNTTSHDAKSGREELGTWNLDWKKMNAERKDSASTFNIQHPTSNIQFRWQVRFADH